MVRARLTLGADNMLTFDVTYEIVDQASAEDGESRESGFYLERATLRDAIDAINGCGAHIEANSYPFDGTGFHRWFTAYGEMDAYSGDQESRSLHLPRGVTPSSALRIARLIGCYGVKRHA